MDTTHSIARCELGSYVSDGFVTGVSDVDVVVVTSVEADALDLVGLASIHDGLVGRRPEWSDRVEVVYIGQATLRSYRSSLGRLAVISPGEPFQLRDDRVAEWVQNWYLVRETGRALDGPPPAAVVIRGRAAIFERSEGLWMRITPTSISSLGLSAET